LIVDADANGDAEAANGDTEVFAEAAAKAGAANGDVEAANGDGLAAIGNAEAANGDAEGFAEGGANDDAESFAEGGANDDAEDANEAEAEVVVVTDLTGFGCTTCCTKLLVVVG